MALAVTEGLWPYEGKSIHAQGHNPPVTFGDSPLCTKGPFTLQTKQALRFLWRRACCLFYSAWFFSAKAIILL